MTNYILESAEFALENHIRSINGEIDQLMTEATFMISSLESGHIEESVLEEGGVVSKTVSMFKKIIEFVKRIFKKFLEKMGIMSRTNISWLNNNKRSIQKLSTESSIEIEMTPYWIGADKVRAIAMLSNSNELSRIASCRATEQQASRFKTVDSVKDEFFKQWTDREGKLTQGIKNLFRTGDVNKVDASVVLSGSSFSSKIKTFEKYVRDYEINIKGILQKEFDSIVRSSTLADKMLESTQWSEKSKTTKESSILDEFSLLEGVTYGETELINLVMTPVWEADSPTKASDKKVDAPTKVKVLKHSNERESNFSENSRVSSQSVITAAKNVLTVAQSVIATEMTMYEEVVHAYMNALKSATAEINKNGSRKENRDIDASKAEANSGDI